MTRASSARPSRATPPALVALAERGRAPSRRAGCSPTQAWRSVADERRYLRALRRHPNGAVLVAEADGEIVGRLSIARDPHPASPHVADLGLMVAAAHRRRGVGTALLAAAEDWARGAGVTKLELHVFPHNDAGDRALREARLRARGPTAAATTAARTAGFVDAILMAKFLEADARTVPRAVHTVDRRIGP